jgi:hypothetical protein
MNLLCVVMSFTRNKSAVISEPLSLNSVFHTFYAPFKLDKFDNLLSATEARDFSVTEIYKRLLPLIQLTAVKVVLQIIY